MLHELRKTWEIDTDFHSARVSKKKKYFNELSSNERLTNLETKFKYNVFKNNLNVIITQINHTDFKVLKC